MACENPNFVWERKPANGIAGKKMPVPCGTCILCRVEQTRQNAVLILHEAKMHDEACMITLTYSDENIPPNGSLQYADVQKLWKRLRKAGKKFRYFAVGEYGDKTNRPHYHACVFGLSWTENRIITQQDPLKWVSPELNAEWGLGYTDIVPLSFTTAAYAASYVQKKLTEKKPYVNLDQETGEIIFLEQPKAYRSESLGKTWWEKHHQQTIDHDHIIINGIRQKPPKKYDEWLKEKNPTELERIKRTRKQKARQNIKNPGELRARAKNAHARINAKRKTL